MKFADIKANGQLCQALVGMVDSGRVPHAILLHEEDGGQGISVALAFLQYLFCHSHSGSDSCGECPSCNKISKLIHPDVHFVFPVNSGKTADNYIEQWRSLVLGNPCFTEEELGEALALDRKNTMIAVSAAKQILDVLSLSALEGGYRAVVIYLPEKMNAEAANRLLKIIEEPPQMTQFVLVTHAPERVLTTIASRCQRLRVMPSGAPRRQSGEQYAPLMEELMGSLIAKDLLAALDVADKVAALPSRENAKAFCKFAADSLRKVFLLQQGLEPLVQDASDSEKSWAGACRRSFAREALELLSRANQLIDRNVNLKIVFAEMAGRLYSKI